MKRGTQKGDVGLGSQKRTQLPEQECLDLGRKPIITNETWHQNHTQSNGIDPQSSACWEKCLFKDFVFRVLAETWWDKFEASSTQSLLNSSVGLSPSTAVTCSLMHLFPDFHALFPHFFTMLPGTISQMSYLCSNPYLKNCSGIVRSDAG